MKNYYDDLEVSKTASKEVIEKVYKVLAKKYHPDTTKEADKQAAEEKFKIISEAYEVLSDDEKRKKYDLELEQSNPVISYEEYINVVNQRDYLSNTLKGLQNEFNQFRNSYNAQAQYQQNQFNQTHYNPNFNNTFNNYQKPNMNTNYTNPNVSSQKKKYYYNTVTGQPVSSFEYFKYKIKNIITSIIFYILIIVVLILFLKNILMFGL